MYRHRAAVLGAATVVAVLGLSGCSHGEPSSSPAAPTVPLLTPSVVTATMESAALPTPAALTDVLYRLVDPAVPGGDKLGLIEATKPGAAEALDRFVTALRDDGYSPLTFDATHVAWSDREPGTTVATVNVTTANPGTAGFSFPMEFKPHGDGWQLSQKTAALLLAFGNSRTPVPPGNAPIG